MGGAAGAHWWELLEAAVLREEVARVQAARVLELCSELGAAGGGFCFLAAVNRGAGWRVQKAAPRQLCPRARLRRPNRILSLNLSLG